MPDLVDPDRWLRVSDGLHLVRLVRRDGTVRVDLRSYYVGRSRAGQHVALHLSAAKRALLVVDGHQLIKTLPLKGLSGQVLRFEAFVRLMMGQARAEHRLRSSGRICLVLELRCEETAAVTRWVTHTKSGQ